MKYNSNLITLKCVLFLVFGGIGCLLLFLPQFMTERKLVVEEVKIISVVAPCVAILGPLVAAALTDKLAANYGGKPNNKNGKYMRIIIATCLLLSVVCYWLLMLIPAIVRDPNPPSIALYCDARGGKLYQKRCSQDKPCHTFDTDEIAFVNVTDCKYACKGEEFNDTTTEVPEVETSEYDDDYYTPSSGDDQFESESSLVRVPQKPMPHPHLCYTYGGKTYCEVQAPHSRPSALKIVLGAPEEALANETREDDNTCAYNVVGGNLQCRMGPQIEGNLTVDITCDPVIRCTVGGTILTQTKCSNDGTAFWWFLIVRSIADIFPAAAIAVLGAAVVIATRETSTGRGDVGKQFALGALGLALFAPIAGCVSTLIQLIIFSGCMIIAAVILLFDDKMPLTPPEWWWHTRCGILAFPMSTIRKYNLETAGLGVVLLILGIFWNGIDIFLPWHILALEGSSVNTGLTVTVGALPAVVFLIYIEKIADYCGHTNILIAAFAFYIIHYTGLAYFDCLWKLLLVESLEIFTLHVIWVTAVMYLRHLVPRKFTALGQALPVIAHFCLGRMIGGLLAGIAYPKARNPNRFILVQQWFAVCAAVIGVIYFLMYHFVLKPRCAAPVTEPPRPSPALIQSVNGNGSYTPLRVYHNGRAKKGQFRY